MAVAAAALIAAGAVSFPFHGKREIPKGCSRISTLESRVAASRELHNFRPVDRAHVADAAAIFNLMPPESNDQWDAAYLIDGPDNTGALVMAKAGLACGMTVLTGDNWTALLRAIELPSS